MEKSSQSVMQPHLESHRVLIGELKGRLGVLSLFSENMRLGVQIIRPPPLLLLSCEAKLQATADLDIA